MLARGTTRADTIESRTAVATLSEHNTDRNEDAGDDDVAGNEPLTRVLYGELYNICQGAPVPVGTEPTAVDEGSEVRVHDVGYKVS